MVDHENHENEAMIDYSYSMGQVTLLGTPVGKLDNEKVKKWLRKTDSSYFSHRLVQACHPKVVDETVCPYCGESNLVVEASPGKVEIGFCPQCWERLYRYDGKVYTQVANRSGYVKFESIL